MKLDLTQKLNERMEQDIIYQQLMRECIDAEGAFLQLRNPLSADGPQVLERYISACEEMDHRKLQLALELHSDLSNCF